MAREEELTQIHEILRNDDGRRTVILHGLGGMGKTQLTLAYIKRHQKDYSAVIWLNTRDETSLKQSFTYAAERIVRQHPSTVYIQNALKDRDLDQTTQAVKRWLGEPRNNHWLVVYDNYDDPRFDNLTTRWENSKDGRRGEREAANLQSQMSMEKGFDIRPFFPDNYQGHIIITTRSSAVHLGEVIRLGKLRNIHDSLRILASTSHRQGLDGGKIQLIPRNNRIALTPFN